MARYPAGVTSGVHRECRVTGWAHRCGASIVLASEAARGRAAALHEVPDRVPPGLPGLLNFWGLGGLDGSGGEVVLARGDLDPGVDGGDLAFPVTQLGLLRAGDGRKPGDEVAPGGFVDGPGFQGLAPLLVVDRSEEHTS